jgi:hypothetical protein
LFFVRLQWDAQVEVGDLPEVLDGIAAVLALLANLNAGARP